MSEMVTKKVTLEDLIAKKDEIQASKKKTVKLYIESLDGYVVMNKPDRKLIADAMELDNPIESNIHVAYNCMAEPSLKDKDVQKAFGVHTPKDLLQEIFNDGEIGFMAESLMDEAGYKKGSVKVIEEIKN